MRVLIAPDKFKGSLNASEVSACIARGFSGAWPEAELTLCPLADGGEGTMELLVRATGGRTVDCEVTGPLGEKRRAPLGILGDGTTAVVEMAAASGLALVPRDSRDPLVTTTAGTGELIRCALDAGLRRVIVGIGGSATNDGGAGMAAALGARFLDSSGSDLPPGGGALAGLAALDLSGMDPRLGEAEIIVASDVANPLLGEEGASRVYGPQKGADAEAVERLERGLSRLAEAVESALGRSFAELPGAGAAGGLGFGLMAFLGAEVRPGIEVVMEAVGFEEKLAGRDLVITGEGRLDAQTAHGKTVTGVARAAARRGIPVLALGGEVAEGAEKLRELGVTALMGIARGPMSLEESMSGAGRLLEACARELASLLRAMGEVR
ncbi:MAG: glycerate kinase [Actinobacteria bacterium]|nr:glycerate kinase [Actinomycetota bacterium]